MDLVKLLLPIEWPTAVAMMWEALLIDQAVLSAVLGVISWGCTREDHSKSSPSPPDITISKFNQTQFTASSNRSTLEAASIRLGTHAHAHNSDE